MVIVKSGSWTYAGKVEKPVDVVGLSFDFWFEIARLDEQLEPGDKPQPLDDAGLIYYIRFQYAGQTSEPTWPDSIGYGTIDAAMLSAEARSRVPLFGPRHP